MKQAPRIAFILAVGAIGIIGAYLFRQWRLNKHHGPMPTEWTSEVKEDFKSKVSLGDYSASSESAKMPDWSQFLGPRRDGVLPTAKIAKKWPETGPRELWKVDIGEGFGGAAIRDGEVYLADRQDDEKDVM
ncbi:MAG: hypothetical protein P1V97_11670, partial [Planctomycetota bacterium]|nr:hypothetical protein [Planctomycetota bacterium]